MTSLTKSEQERAVVTLTSDGPVGKHALEDVMAALEAPFTQEEVGRDAGLSSDQILRLLEAIMVKHRLGDQDGFLASSVVFATRFWQCLVPCERLSGGCSRAVASMAAFALANKDWRNVGSSRYVHKFLLWVEQLLHYSLVDEDALASVYDAFFQHLDDEKVNRILCEILSHLTVNGSSDSLVKRWRAERLMAVRGRTGTFPEIDLLLGIYQALRPDLVNCPLTRRRPRDTRPKRKASSSKRDYFDLLWSDSRHGVTTARGKSRFLENTSIGSLALNLDRRQLLDGVSSDDVLPSLSPEHKQNRGPVPNEEKEELEEEAPRAVQLTSLKNVSDLLESMNRLEVPSQALSLIRNDFTMLLLVFHPDEGALKERLSITLYYSLHHYFLSSSRKNKRSSGMVRQRKQLLARVDRLQDFFQQGVPVLGRFISEYVSEGWDGRDYLTELLKLLVYLPMADFEEVFDCILAPLHNHFLHTWDAVERLRVLFFLHKLLLHWIYVEYERVLQHLGKNPDGSRLKEAAAVSKAKRRKSSMMPPKTANILNVFPPNSNGCTTPLQTLVEVFDIMGQWVNVAMADRCKLKPRRQAYNDVEADAFKRGDMDALETRVFVGEVLTYYHVLTRSLVAKKIPVILQVPASLIYWSLLGESPDHLSSSLTHLADMKKSVQPMAAARKQMYRSKGDDASADVVEAQMENLKCLNTCTRDALSVLIQEPVDKNSTLSLFNSDWGVVESEVMDGFGLETHPALLARLVEFKTLTDRKKTPWSDFIHHIGRNVKYFREYVTFLREKEPGVMGFLDAMGAMDRFGLGSVAKQTSDKAESQLSQGRHSVATRSSGIGTMH